MDDRADYFGQLEERYAFDRSAGDVGTPESDVRYRGVEYAENASQPHAIAS
jgi:hypothetical protein